MQSSYENHPNGDAAVAGTLASTPNGAAQTPHRHIKPLKSHFATDWRNQKSPSGFPPRHQPPYLGSRGKAPGWNRWIQKTAEYRYEEPDASYSREAWKATEEGRRLYFGNLDWQIRAADVALWLEGAGYNLKVVDMPAKMDEGIKRPLFCFVEFYTVEETEAVRAALGGHTMRGRPVKIDYSKGTHTRAASISHAQEPQTPSKVQVEVETGSPKAHSSHKMDNTPAAEVKNTPMGGIPESARLFVGGLPHVENINELEDLVRELFLGFHVESLSDIMSPKKPKFMQHESNHINTSYCFVDLANVAEAKMAVRFLNKRETSWGAARVNFAAGGVEGKLKYRGYENNQPKQHEQNQQEEAVGKEVV